METLSAFRAGGNSVIKPFCDWLLINVIIMLVDWFGRMLTNSAREFLKIKVEINIVLNDGLGI